MAGIGHNNGPDLSGDLTWRRYAWSKARSDLLPTLPIEVVRLRVKRAAELGLPYKTYAGVRAASGRDVIGFLFSTNALRLLCEGQALPADRRAKLAGLVSADRTALVQPPLDPRGVITLDQIDSAHPAPLFTASWTAMRDQIRAIIQSRNLPRDAILIIGETSAERDWADAGKTAGFLTGDRYFAPLPG